MNDYDIKRLKRDIASYESYLELPLKRHIISNVLLWGLFMGPLIFLITRYEKGVPMPWDQLPLYLLLFAVAGGLVNTTGLHLLYKWQLKKLNKKLEHIQN